MDLEFRQRRVTISPALHDQIAGHVQAALGRFSHRIRNVMVYLTDINGRRGGVDKYCGIVVQLSGGRTICARELNAQVEIAFYFAVDRAAYAVSRELERRRTRIWRRRPWIAEAG